METMNKLKKGMIALVLIAFSTSASLAKDGIKFQHNLTMEQAIAKAKKENKNLFIDIYATWCGPCKYLSGNVFTDEQLGTYMNENFICLKLDGEKMDGMLLMNEFELSAFPTMLFLSPDRKLLKKMVGVEPAESIRAQAGYIVNPETHPLYKAQQQYVQGKRDRDFVSELIMNTLEEGSNPMEMVKTFINDHPTLDMEKESELVIFVLGIDDMEDKNYAEFLQNTDKYMMVSAELCEAKMENLLNTILFNAIETNNKASIPEKVERIYNAYKTTYLSNSLEKKDLIKAMETAFDEQS